MRKAAGFTLLELLLVITIVAIASTGAAMALRDSAQAGLETEALRLAALLELGRSQSRSSGLPVRWVATTKGFTLNGKNQTWLTPGVQATIEPPLLLGPEPVIAPQSATLWLTEQPQYQLRVATDGIRPFAVQSLSTTGAVP